MKCFLFTSIFFLFLGTSCKKESLDTTLTTCILNNPINTNHSKALTIQQVIDKYTQGGLPGIAIAVYSNEGFWAGASGYSKIETPTSMQPCHLQYSQSVSKTYMAVAILKLYEQGKINLDKKITAYLPSSINSKIKGADQVTVRMLLNHTSGIPEYNDVPAYVSYLLQHPFHKFSSMDYLDFIEGKSLQFTPGSKSKYTNTNYLLLALIGDQITGDHAKFIRTTIFQPLGLVHSFYHDDENYLNKTELVNSYWDRYSNGAIENCSRMQQINVSSLIGDDGMIASPLDYVKFLKALFEGQILSPTTLNEMLTFVKNDPAKSYGYGLGIATNKYNQYIRYGHTGGGIGAGCELGYFPDKNVYFFIAINIGTSINSPILEKAENMQEEIYAILTQ